MDKTGNARPSSQRSRTFLSRSLTGIYLITSPLFLQAAPPINDQFAQRQVIPSLATLVSGSNLEATLETSEPIAEGASVWWQWTPSETGTVIISTVGSDFDTILDVYSGAALPQLSAVVSDDDSGGKFTSRVYFRAFAGETLQIRVSGAGGDSGNIVLHLERPTVSAPRWRITDFDGRVIRSEDYTNRVVLFDFFETTCGGCIDEADDLVATQNQLGNRGVSLVGTATDDIGASQLRFFQHNFNINYPLGFSDGNLVNQFGGVDGVPFKYLIDRENKIVATHVGSGDTNLYLHWIAPLIRSNPNLILRLARDSGGISARWPAAEFGIVLEENPGLDPHSWVTSSGRQENTGGEIQVRLAPTAETRFLRLRRVQP